MVAMNRNRTTGFTLMELMITIALVGVLAGLAAPNLRQFMLNNRLTAHANDMLRSINLARTEAIKRQAGNVVVCATTNPAAADAAIVCNNGAMRGWFVYVDTAAGGTAWQHDAVEPVLEKHELVDADVTVRNDNVGILGFTGTGFVAATRTRNIVICDSRGNAIVGGRSAARAVLITATGRSRVSSDPTEVTTAITATGSSCP
jgi:type IV fimbrial biogenesis protein FimT